MKLIPQRYYDTWLTALEKDEFNSHFYEWLTKYDLLIEKVREVTGNDFSVQIFPGEIREAEMDEQDILNCQQVYYKESFIYGRQKPWVYSRIVIPAESHYSIQEENMHPGGLKNLLRNNNLYSGYQYRLYRHFSIGAASTLEGFMNSQIWGRRRLIFMQEAETFMLVNEFFSILIPAFSRADKD